MAKLDNSTKPALPEQKQAYSSHSSWGNAVEKPLGKPPILPSQNPADDSSEDMVSLFTWPMQIVAAMMTPWRLWPAALSYIHPHGTLPSRTIETDKEYRYVIDIGDAANDQLALSCEQGALTLQIDQQTEQHSSHSHAQQTRHIKRSFTLPPYTDSSRITAHIADKQLIITVPKTHTPIQTKAHRIAITS